jgi:hypothetical protein
MGAVPEVGETARSRNSIGSEPPGNDRRRDRARKRERHAEWEFE